MTRRQRRRRCDSINADSSSNPTVGDAPIAVRGATAARDTWLRAHGDRHTVLVAEKSKSFVGKNGQELRRFLTSFANKQVYMPHMIKKGNDWFPLTWKSKELDHYKARCIYEVFGRFSFVWEKNQTPVREARAQKFVLRQVNRSWKGFKTRWYREKVRNQTMEQRLRNKPRAMTEDHWLALIFHYMSTEYQNVGQQNSTNISKLGYSHIGGSCPIPHWQYNMEQATGVRPLWVATHDHYYVRKDGTPVTEAAGHDNEKLHRATDQAIAPQMEASQGMALTQEQMTQADNEAFQMTFGQDKHGRVRMGGYGTSPTEYFNESDPLAIPSCGGNTTSNPTVSSNSTAAPSTEDVQRDMEAERYRYMRWCTASGVPIPEDIFTPEWHLPIYE